MVARFLTGWIRGIGYMLNPENRQKSEGYLHDFNEKTLEGYRASPGDIENDFALRPFFDLDQQIEIFDRSEGKSEVDTWYEALSTFLVDNNVISTNPPVDTYITDKYLKMVYDNETLRDFTARSSAGYVDPEDVDSETDAQASSSGSLSMVFCYFILAVFGRPLAF